MRGLGARFAVVAAAAGIAALAMFGLTSPAPGATSADGELRALPGLDAVTYGQMAAFSASVENTGNVTLKNVTLHQPIPTTEVDGETQPAVFQSAGCTGTVSASEFSCVVTDKLRPGDSIAVTIVWQTPSAGSSSDCESDPCLVATGFWQSGPGSRTFPMDPIAVELLDGNDPSQAATYALAACTDPSDPTLATDPDVDVDNPLATSVCASSLPASALGLVTSIEEKEGEESDPGITQVSEICLPSPGTECDASPFVFSPLATFTFVVTNASLPAGEKIDTVYHDGVVVSKSKRADPRVVSIKNEKFKGITTIVVVSSTNGSWRFG